jgi:hypothetical protein
VLFRVSLGGTKICYPDGVEITWELGSLDKLIKHKTKQLEIDLIIGRITKLIRFHLFRRKKFGKCFLHFLVFGATENNCQIENILYLTKKACLVSENDFHFKIS